MSVLTPAHLHMNVHLQECVSVLCKQSGSCGMPGVHCIARCAAAVPGWLQGLVSRPCRAPARDGKPREQTAGGVLYLEWDAPSHARTHAGFI